jgi:hypothetical protein
MMFGCGTSQAGSTWPDGRLTRNALTGRAISPRAARRPWDHELSGRLRSLTKEAEGRAYCQKGEKPFVGVMYSEWSASDAKPMA